VRDGADVKRQLEAAVLFDLPSKKDFAIGCVGAGSIMNNTHLTAYRKAGFNPAAIYSRGAEGRERAAQRHSIKKIYDDWKNLIADEEIEILDIALPPDIQVEVVREGVKHKHIKGILCQKPIAMSLDDARGIAIAVNSNMRCDPSMRALKCALNLGLLGTPVLATIEMRVPLHWQEYLKKYSQLELYGMGIHHIDIFRFLFGDPEKITALCRTDPRVKFPHTDGITQYTFQYADGFMASCLDDTWAGPDEPCEQDTYIKWRVEGLDGMALGTISWAAPPRQSSTLRLTNKAVGGWIEPKWDTHWFPDAFTGTMAGLLRAVEDKTKPDISAEDNVTSIACIEACYASIREGRTVRLEETQRV
jgi:predicted dehydrogenase